ncbi:MAG: hypothetical protein ACI81Q_001060 [Paracoccaceae bacterium]
MLGVLALSCAPQWFFPEVDDSEATREAVTDTNAKGNEFLFHRVDLVDAAIAQICMRAGFQMFDDIEWIMSEIWPWTTLAGSPNMTLSVSFPKFPMTNQSAVGWPK